MKECKPCLDVQSFQSIIMLNLDFSGTFPVGVRPWPNYSTLFFNNSHLSILNPTRYFSNTLHTHLKLINNRLRLVEHVKIFSIILLLPEIILMMLRWILSFSVTLTVMLPKSFIFLTVLRKIMCRSIFNSPIIQVCINMSHHAFRVRPDNRLETMALVKQNYVLVQNIGNRR